MNEPLYSDETLVDYLDGRMDAGERERFEEDLAKDAQLKQRLDDLKAAVEAVRQFAVRDRVGVLHKEMMEELKGRPSVSRVVNMRRTIRISLAVAASVLLIVVGVKTFNPSRNDAETLYTDAFVDYTLPVERGPQQSTTVLEKDYSEKNYPGVIKDAESNILSPKDSFLTAISFLKTGSSSKAIQWLNSVDSLSAFYPDAQFYLSLAYLRNKNYENASELMNEIHSDSNHPYHSNISNELIERVKKLK